MEKNTISIELSQDLHEVVRDLAGESGYSTRRFISLIVEAYARKRGFKPTPDDEWWATFWNIKLENYKNNQ